VALVSLNQGKIPNWQRPGSKRKDFFAPGTLQHLVYPSLLRGLATSAKMVEHSSYELLIAHMRWTVEASKKIKTQQNNTNPPTYP
jgi:hypothetical protein